MSLSLPEIIPPDWARWSASKPSVVRPLQGGLTNKSFLINADDDLLVLRKNSAISAALDLNRHAEAEALRLADKAGLCAPLIHCDPEHQYLVTRYIQGGSWVSEREGALQQLANLLRQIHTLPLIDVHLDIKDKVTRYWRSIDDSADFFAELQALGQQMQRHIDTALSLRDGVCLCHNDLLMANLIAAADGQLYAIDWEYAAMGDPFYELAVIVEEYELKEPQQQLLLEEYLLRSVTRLDWQRLHHWRMIYGYLSLLWYAVQWCSGAMNEPSVKAEIVNEVNTLSKRCCAIHP